MFGWLLTEKPIGGELFLGFPPNKLFSKLGLEGEIALFYFTSVKKKTPTYIPENLDWQMIGSLLADPS